MYFCISSLVQRVMIKKLPTDFDDVVSFCVCIKQFDMVYGGCNCVWEENWAMIESDESALPYCCAVREEWLALGHVDVSR